MDAGTAGACVGHARAWSCRRCGLTHGAVADYMTSFQVPASRSGGERRAPTSARFVRGRRRRRAARDVPLLPALSASAAHRTPPPRLSRRGGCTRDPAPVPARASRTTIAVSTVGEFARTANISLSATCRGHARGPCGSIGDTRTTALGRIRHCAACCRLPCTRSRKLTSPCDARDALARAGRWSRGGHGG